MWAFDAAMKWLIVPFAPPVMVVKVFGLMLSVSLLIERKKNFLGDIGT